MVILNIKSTFHIDHVDGVLYMSILQTSFSHFLSYYRNMVSLLLADSNELE